MLRDCYLNFIDLYAKTHKYKQAYKYQQLFIAVNDSINNKESTNKISELKIIYETEQKGKENILLKQENEIQQLKTKS